MRVRYYKDWHLRQVRNPMRHFQRYSDLPKARRADLVTGEIGIIHNMRVISDQFRSNP
jgi:hypothetical protein